MHIGRVVPFLPPLTDIDPERFTTPAVLKRLSIASRRLGELKGIAASIPNQGILINTLGIQEAKDSSAIENIVTTHDELFRNDAADGGSPEAKEVRRYREALYEGFRAVTATGLLTNRHILDIHARLERTDAGFRRVPGTVLRNPAGDTVYTPPPPDHIDGLMHDLERFINDDAAPDLDPLIRMVLIHYQFESIHPFYDGNGRTGRILNALYLVKEGLLTIPVLYMSRQILRTKAEYYRLLQAVRDDDAWEDWVCYLLGAVEQTAAETVTTIEAIKAAWTDYQQRIRAAHRFYSQDLVNNLFRHPYTKIAFVCEELQVTRVTATRYLDDLVADGLLEKRRVGRTNYYVNVALNAILTGERMRDGEPGAGT